jgi:hypothetical protein
MAQCRKPVIILCCFLLFPVFLCEKSPTESQYRGVGDCGRPTIPYGLQFYDSVAMQKSSVESDSTVINFVIPPPTGYYEYYVYMEIYDYEKTLINNYLDGPIITTQKKGFNTYTPFDIYWNGLDSKGNKVGNGQYIFKFSYISKYDTACRCGEYFITTN